MTYAIATSHQATLDAAQQILVEGGNAVDAAIGAALTACVAEPMHASLGGGGLAVVMPTGQLPRAYDFLPRSPLRRKNPKELDIEEVFLEALQPKTRVCIGPGSVAVPGLVAGLFGLHADLGYMPFDAITEPAVEYAKTGVALGEYGAATLWAMEPVLAAHPQAWERFRALDDCAALIGADQSKPNLALADLMEVLALEGPDLFYRGEVAVSLVNALNGGGQFELEDLASFDVRPRACWQLEFGDCEIWAIPAPIGAGAVLLALQLRLLGAPHAQLPETFGGAHRRQLGLSRQKASRQTVEAVVAAGPGEAVYETSPLDLGLREHYARTYRGRPLCLGSGTQICLGDKAGALVSLALTNGQGAGCMIDNAGSMTNNLLGQGGYDRLDFTPGITDVHLPSALCPLLLRWPDGAVAALGNGGRTESLNALAQVLEVCVRHGLALEAAVCGPRLEFDDDLLLLEGPLDEDKCAELFHHFPEYEQSGENEARYGVVNAVRTTPAAREAVGDPRGGGVAASL